MYVHTIYIQSQFLGFHSNDLATIKYYYQLGYNVIII